MPLRSPVDETHMHEYAKPPPPRRTNERPRQLHLPLLDEEFCFELRSGTGMRGMLLGGRTTNPSAAIGADMVCEDD